MQLIAKPLTQLTILGAMRAPGLGALDPINVIIDNTGPTAGHITITCYGRAWTAYWSSMGTDLASFFCRCDPDYICDNMVRSMTPTLQRMKKSEEKYLTDIIVAVQAALRQQGGAA